MVVHKWEPDIYIGLSPALHLHCTSNKTKFQMFTRNWIVGLEILFRMIFSHRPEIFMNRDLKGYYTCAYDKCQLICKAGHPRG
jgi:hypothetical protein